MKHYLLVIFDTSNLRTYHYDSASDAKAIRNSVRLARTKEILYLGSEDDEGQTTELARSKVFCEKHKQELWKCTTAGKITELCFICGCGGLCDSNCPCPMGRHINCLVSTTHS